jgi:DNA-binding transcriptional regulator LsrR (DeoR family)
MALKLEGEALKLDDAARAGWLYFIAGKTQAEIAEDMAISRQSVQRLVALAVSERLVKMRLDHPIARCMELAEELRAAFGLRWCQVTPSDASSGSETLGIANAAAALLESYLAQSKPLVVAMGTGEELRAAADQLRKMHCPHHKLVSLVGNIHADGSANLLDAISRAAEAVGAPHYPMPCSVIAPSKEERDAILALRHVRQIMELGLSADLTLVGVGSMALEAPLVRDGFMTPTEMRAMIGVGAAGEITGWGYDDQGVLIEGLTNERVLGARPRTEHKGLTIGVSMAPDRSRAIRAAMIGRLINGLITNDAMARRLLSSR